ncbi:MAG: hypothetical protein M0R38_03820 [Bacteroidia bacterium]|nr:hypothetical protein [Bacteroidia bacterium]
MLIKISNILLALSDLSLPVVFGGAVCFSFFANLHQIEYYYPIIWICCSGIFAIYLYDHLADLKSTSQIEIGAPFWILYRFKKIWIVVSVLSLLIAFYILLTKMRLEYLMPGGIVALLVLGYYLFRKFAPKKIQGQLKELWISLVATMALGGISAWITTSQIHWILLISFFLICFQNMLLFSWIDFEHDVINQNLTLAVSSGISYLVWILDIVSLVNLAMLADLWHSEGFSFAIVIFLLMQLQLFIIRILCEYKGTKRVYRFWTDMVFVLPLLSFI